jgi:hypothetical protein
VNRSCNKLPPFFHRKFPNAVTFTGINELKASPWPLAPCLESRICCTRSDYLRLRFTHGGTRMAPCWLLDIAPNLQYQRFADLRLARLPASYQIKEAVGRRHKDTPTNGQPEHKECEPFARADSNRRSSPDPDNGECRPPKSGEFCELKNAGNFVLCASIKGVGSRAGEFERVRTPERSTTAGGWEWIASRPRHKRVRQIRELI